MLVLGEFKVRASFDLESQRCRSEASDPREARPEDRNSRRMVGASVEAKKMPK